VRGGQASQPAGVVLMGVASHGRVAAACACAWARRPAGCWLLAAGTAPRPHAVTWRAAPCVSTGPGVEAGGCCRRMLMCLLVLPWQVGSRRGSHLPMGLAVCVGCGTREWRWPAALDVRGAALLVAGWGWGRWLGAAARRGVPLGGCLPLPTSPLDRWEGGVPRCHRACARPAGRVASGCCCQERGRAQAQQQALAGKV
jgi:hypothetical protein